MSSLYDLVEIKISGSSTHARPIDFTYDDKRQPISVKKIVTTCPKCSSYNEYEVDIKEHSKVLILECKHCGKSDGKQSITVEKKLDTSKIKISESIEPDFIDPVQAGLFHVEQV